MIRTVAVLLVATALAMSHWWSYKKGERTDKQRSDLVIARMVNEANEKLLKANAIIKQQTDALQATVDKANHDLQTEKARNARRVADAVATDRLVRDELAAFARGAGEADPAAAACRGDAGTIGNVLGDVLQDYRTCVAGAEKEAASARTLLNAWPTVRNP